MLGIRMSINYEGNKTIYMYAASARNNRTDSFCFIPSVYFIAKNFPLPVRRVAHSVGISILDNKESYFLRRRLIAASSPRDQHRPFNARLIAPRAHDTRRQICSVTRANHSEVITSTKPSQARPGPTAQA